MKSRILILLGLLILLFVVVTLTRSIKNSLGIPTGELPNTPPIDEPVACTMDAKMCPDGSYVGRIGPNCDFAACPAGAPVTDTTTVETRLGQIGTIVGLSITPIEVLEDSRCPSDVVCIQAGTVRLRTRLGTPTGTTEQNFTLNQPVTSGLYTIELISVMPGTVSTVPIKKEDYRFTFKVTR